MRALSAVDGRYRRQTEPLIHYFSEEALIRYRIRIEIAWLAAVLRRLRPDALTAAAERALESIADLADKDETAVAVKRLESETRHDVKAIEYWLNGQLDEKRLSDFKPFVHFACTSWDINNIAYTLQVTDGIKEVLTEPLQTILDLLRRQAEEYADTPMLSRTHGQPASPTTLGKEFANYVHRLAPRCVALANRRLPAKMNGAVGNYNAHIVARPDIQWPEVAREFIESWGLRFATHTTQIEPYDDLAECFDSLRRINVILTDLCRDFWGYISLDYFTQQAAGGKETGSSTMPHKINPIDFENAEGNLGIANALLAHLADKLPISRWQRDLSDSTALRNVGGAFGHCLLAWRGVAAGLQKITANTAVLSADLQGNWQVLTEAIQTVLRAEGVDGAYELLKDFSRGKVVGERALKDFIAGLPISSEAKERLSALTPETYHGLATDLSRQFP